MGVTEPGRFAATVSVPPEPHEAVSWDSSVRLAGEALKTAFGASITIDVRIATVPDPIDSGLQYHFDTVLQALRLGVESGSLDQKGGIRRFYRDRSWLPWDDPYVDGSARAASEACRRTTPGVILFRGGSDLDRSVVVLLLVGETPTVGLHPTAMLHALEAAEAWRSVGSELKIIGPTYSGSARSLRISLERWKSAHPDPVEAPDVRIVTGSASGAHVSATLRDAPWITFNATTVPAQVVECVYLNFVHNQLGVERQGPLLAGVAFLHESGTEFGSASTAQDRQTWSCPLAPEAEIQFPFHVSALRDAYEDMDWRHDPGGGSEAAPVRRTALDVSVREPRRPLDVEAPPFQKTMNAEDVALSRVLAEVSHEGIRYVGIQATDVADAIFVARKIRDVAPDVRLAFFDSDALLMHPAFNHDLFGSFVVSPYPFLGADDFSPRSSDKSEVFQHDHFPFESALAEGIFNATLAMERFPPTRLREYAFTGESSTASPLPVWIATIGSAEIVPVAVRPSINCAATIHGREEPCRDERERHLCVEACGTGGAPTTTPRTTLLAEFNAKHLPELHVDPDVTPPKLWHFVFAVLMLGAILDRRRQRRAREEMSIETLPKSLETDREISLALGRAKWSFYAVIRGLILLLSLAYMTSIELVAVLTYGGLIGGDISIQLLTRVALFLGVLATPLMGWSVWRNIKRFWAWRCLLRAFLDRELGPPRSRLARLLRWSWVLGQHLDPTRPVRVVIGNLLTAIWKLLAALWSRVQRWLGFADLKLASAPIPARPEAPPTHDIGSVKEHGDWVEVVGASYAQLRTLGICVVLTLVLFAGMFVYKLGEHDVGAWAAGAVREPGKWRVHLRPVPAMTLFVLRALPLVNGVSPSAPGMLTMACAYVWAVGRMARLRLAHTLSVIAPEDGVADAMSTPIRAVLFPLHSQAKPGDLGFTSVERSLLNAIWRPSTGAGYFFSLLVILFFPFVLFFLKRPTTLDGRPYIFFGSLGLCFVLIGATLIQLMQYWLALEHLLKRIMEHPLGRAFARVDAFVREPLDDLDLAVAERPSPRRRVLAEVRGAHSLCAYPVVLGTPRAHRSGCLGAEGTRRRALFFRRSHARSPDGAGARSGCPDGCPRGGADSRESLAGRFDVRSPRHMSARTGSPRRRSTTNRSPRKPRARGSLRTAKPRRRTRSRRSKVSFRPRKSRGSARRSRSSPRPSRCS